MNIGGIEGAGEREPIVETVRGAIYHRGRFLILKKDATSKNPAAFEFPGGKIDIITGASANLNEQTQALLSEIHEETGIGFQTHNIERIEDFLTYFESGDGEERKVNRRRVHLFLIRILDSEDISPRINETVNIHGEPEDKHSAYRWVSPQELRTLVLSLEENEHAGATMRPIARNSRHIKKLLEAVNA